MGNTMASKVRKRTQKAAKGSYDASSIQVLEGSTQCVSARYTLVPLVPMVSTTSSGRFLITRDEAWRYADDIEVAILPVAFA